MEGCMLTGKAKVGYLLANSGFMIFIVPAWYASSGRRDALDLALIVIATTLFLFGSALMGRGSIATNVGRLLSGPPVLQSGRDWLALALVLFGAFLLPPLLQNIRRGESIATQWPFFALVLSALVVGWFLVLNELYQSRSRQE
jgi:hypothetical protein